jgi:hypothetical protein
MYQTTMCPSSGEITIYVTLPTCLSVWMTHTRQLSTQSDKYQVSHRYSYFSWWWAHSRPKHVEKRNKHTKKNCAPSWLYLQGPNSLFMNHPIIWYYTLWVTGTVTNRSLLLLFNYALQPLRLIVRSWLDVPTFATRCLRACHHARAPSSRRWNCGRKMSGNFA